MNDTISRQELYEKVAELEELARNRVLDTPTAIGSQVNPSYIRYSAQLSERTMFKHMVTDFPSAQPRPKGKWVSDDALFSGVPYHCDQCGEKTLNTIMGKPRWNFCPMCGAEMGE